MNDPAKNWANAIWTIVSFVLLLWLIEAVNITVLHGLSVYSIYPRDLDSLPGILVWPLLHANVQHLAVNTTPLLVLGYFVALRGVPVFLQTTLLITVLAGVGIWLFGREAYHIGSSGLVFGYFGFLVAVGIYEKSLMALGIATFVLFYYGGLIYGVLPVNSFVSFEAHLFGLLAGIYAASVLAIRRRRR